MSNYFYKCILLLVVFFLVFVQSLTSIVYAEGGYVWTARPSSGSRTWSAITSSADGTKLAATVSTSTTPGYIYLSTDSGATWATSTSAGQRVWSSITSSADGTKLAATVSSSTAGYIYTSTDSGVTWATSSSYARLWNTITSSADGTKLAATVGVFNTSGNIYLSTDSGVTWATSTALSRPWAGITSSADGTVLAAAIYGAAQTVIYTSIDSGANWTSRAVGAGSLRRWIAGSSDGTKLAVPVFNSSVYTSTTTGVSFVQRTSSGFRSIWNGITSSANGNILLAGGTGGTTGNLILSKDAGVTWTDQLSAGSTTWNAVTSSADGTKLAAAIGGGIIYTALYDVTAPVISNITTNIGTSTFHVSFSTDENATSSIVYTIGSLSDTVYDQTVSTGKTFTLNNLASCAAYTYRLQVDDQNGNATTSPTYSFNTQCPAGATQVNISTVGISKDVGDSLVVDDAVLIVPANYATTDSTFQFSRLTGGSYSAPSGTEYVGSKYYLNILLTASSTLSTSSVPMNLIFSYENENIEKLQESSLGIYRYDGVSWERNIAGCSVNTNSKFVSCSVSNPGLYALIGGYIPPAGATIATSAIYPAPITPIATATSSIVATEGVAAPLVGNPVKSEVYNFARNLTLGSTGEDVRQLQKFLNTNGFIVSVFGPGSKDKESSYFGPATKAALAKFQKANGIVPAVGYFGIITRLKMVMMN